jgi:O-methyltransferase
MSNHSVRFTDELDAYVREVGMRESDTLYRLRKESEETLKHAQLAIMPEEACFLDWLVRLTQTKSIIEIGVYAGYSTLALAQALPQDGKIVAFDRDDRFIKVGRPYWIEAGVDHKIDLRLCEAQAGLEKLLEEAGPESFDFAFIDADKAGYMDYYEKCLELIRPGGVICVDNVLWYGRVVDENDTTRQTASIRAINKHIQADERVDMCLLPIGDGVTVARKK